jgi:hypothetical protein
MLANLKHRAACRTSGATSVHADMPQCAQPAVGAAPVLLVNVAADVLLNALDRLLVALLRRLEVAAELREAIALGLRQVEVARLVDDVKALLLRLAVVEEVDEARGLVRERRRGGERRDAGDEAAEHLHGARTAAVSEVARVAACGGCTALTVLAAAGRRSGRGVEPALGMHCGAGPGRRQLVSQRVCASSSASHGRSQAEQHATAAAVVVDVPG